MNREIFKAVFWGIIAVEAAHVAFAAVVCVCLYWIGHLAESKHPTFESVASDIAPLESTLDNIIEQNRRERVKELYGER